MFKDMKGKNMRKEIYWAIYDFTVTIICLTSSIVHLLNKEWIMGSIMGAIAVYYIAKNSL